VTELRQSHPPVYASPPKSSSSVTRELVSLRQEVERLGNEVHRLGGIVEQGLETRKKARGEETIRLAEGDLISLSDEDVQRVQKDVDTRATSTTTAHQVRQPSKLRQGLHRAGSPEPQVVEASMIAPSPPSEHEHDQQSGSSSGSGSMKGNKTRSKARPTEGPSSPFPSIREEDEVDFFEVSRKTSAPRPAKKAGAAAGERRKSPLASGPEGERDIPPQTVLTRVIAELEADFKHYKSYVPFMKF